MYLQRRLSFLLLLGVASSQVSADSLWMGRFLQERRKALGPVRRHSAAEMNQFYLLEKKGNSDAQSIHFTVNQVKEARPRTKRKKEEDKVEPEMAFAPAKPAVFPKGVLLSKSRRAYESGQLEEARRYYQLVQKADPTSAEAGDRLEILRISSGNGW